MHLEVANKCVYLVVLNASLQCTWEGHWILTTFLRDYVSLLLKPQIKASPFKNFVICMDLKLKLIILWVCAGHATFLTPGKRLGCQNKSHQGRPRSMNCDKFLAASKRVSFASLKWHFLTRVLAPFAIVNICQSSSGKIQQTRKFSDMFITISFKGFQGDISLKPFVLFVKSWH